MRAFILNLLLILIFVSPIYAQKASLEKWVLHAVDSLRNEKVDTAEYYHSYCGECAVRNPASQGNRHSCDVGNGWNQIANVIVYKQNGGYYSLTFDCNYPPIKKHLKDVKSLDYFLSIVPILNKRDRYGKAMQKKRKFNPPIIIDGGYEEAYIYCRNIKQHISMQEDQKTDKAWRSFFWIDKQTQLLALLESETSTKN